MGLESSRTWGLGVGDKTELYQKLYHHKLYLIVKTGVSRD